jgi:hypothetical protein
MSKILNSIEEIFMLNPTLAEIGWLAEAVGFSMFILISCLCFYVERQLWWDPERFAPWCHFRRIGLMIIGVMALISAFGGAAPPRLYHLIAGFALLLFLAGTASTRNHQWYRRGNKAGAFRIADGERTLVK